MNDEEDPTPLIPHPLTRYEKRHDLTVEMRPLKGARRTRKHRFNDEEE